MKRNRLVSVGLLLLDLGSAIVVFNAISHFRGLGAAGQFIVWPLAIPLAAMVFSIYLIEGYKAHVDMLSVDYLSQHTIALLGAMLATLLVTYAVIPQGYELQASRAVIALSFICLVPLTAAYRRAIRLSVLKRSTTRSIVFLGDATSRQAFLEECAKMQTTQPVIFTVPNLESAAPFTPADSTPRAIQDVLHDIESGQVAVEAIVLRESARDLPHALSRRLVELYFAGIPTYTLELFHELYWRKIPLYRLNQTWLFQEGFKIAREPVFERIKRAADIALSTAGLALSAPLIALSALAIWLDDRGPVFFAQTRVGKNHASFRLFKLRTMRHVDSPSTAAYTQPNDARITRVGRFLRATRLDEFPQLWNVLRGEMSLIGPRAEWDRLVRIYENEVPCYHFRHLVKPGITGWAQVNYPYGASIEDTTRKLEYDLYYIRHFSFLLDASIVLKTIHIMLFGKGR